jgi:hypothetical protein
MNFEQFYRTMKNLNLIAYDHGNGHWQVKGKGWVLNWWPESKKRTVHITNPDVTLRYQDFESVIQLAKKLLVESNQAISK